MSGKSDLTPKTPGGEGLLPNQLKDENKTLFQQLLEILPDSVIVTDSDGIIRFVNKLAEALFGYQAAELLGKPVELLIPHRYEKHSQHRQGYSAHPRIRPMGSNLELYALRKDGIEFLVDISLSPLQTMKETLVVAVIRDISLRNLTEQTLKRSEARNRALLDAIPDLILRVHRDGSIWDYKLEKGFDWIDPVADLLGKNLFEIVPSKIAKMARDSIERAEVTQERQFVEYPFDADGDPRYFETWVVPSTTDEFIFVIRDITERKQAAEALLKSERRFRALIENSSDAITLLDANGIAIYDSPAAPGMLGYGPTELIGQNVFELIHPDDLPEISSKFKDIAQTPGAHIRSTFRLRKKSGAWLWIEAIATNLFNEPSVEAIVVNYRDITERKLADDALRESEQRFRLLFTASPDAILLIDPHDPDISWPIVDCNKAACEMNGYAREEMVGQSIDLLNTHAGSLEERAEYMARLQKEGMLHQEIFHRHKDGHLYQIETSTSLVTFGGRELILGIDRDITERKQIEKALRESEQRFRSLFAASPDAIFLIDPHNDESPWKIVDCNEAAIHMNGYSYDELVGQPIDFINAVYETPEEHTDYLERLRTEELIFLEVLHRHKDGHIFPIETSMSLINLGERELVLGIDRDITERKQAEEDIRSRNEELQALYELSRSLSTLNNLNQILDLINRQAVESIHITFSMVILLEEEHFVTRATYPVRVLDHDLPTGDRKSLSSLPYSLQVIEKNKPTILHKDDPNISRDEYQLLSMGLAQTICLIPLRTGDPAPDSSHILGMLVLGEARSEEREPFTMDKIRLAQSIGDQAATAIRRILLQKQTSQRLEQLAALREIDLAIASSFDLKLSLGILVNQVVGQLKVDAATVWIFNNESKVLKFAAGQGFRSKAFERASPLRLGEGYAGQAAVQRNIIHVENLTSQVKNPRLGQALKTEPFYSYYGVPLLAKGSIKGVLEIFHRTPLKADSDWLSFLNILAGQCAIAIDNATMFENLERSHIDLFAAYDETLKGWSAALDLRDEETEGHTRRVTDMTLRLAEKMGIHGQDLIHIRRGGLLHDIGKMGIPDHILLKPGKLTKDEWEIMRKHPTYAYDLLKPISYLRPALDIPYCHHEKWDGTGYPRGLKGEEIPLAARIFAIVDVYDALSSDRPYRSAWSKEKTLEYIHSLNGSHFDPKVVEAFDQLMNIA